MKSHSLILCMFFLLSISSYASNIFLPLNVFEASDLSEELDKNIFVYYYEDDCIFCDLADDSLFTNPDVRKVLAEEYISVKANYRNSIYATWYDKYKVTCLPTMQIISPDGELIYEIKGVSSVDSFLQVLSSNNQILRAEFPSDSMSEESLDKTRVDSSEADTLEIREEALEASTISEEEYFTVQLGAFRQFDNAINFRRKLENDFGINISIFESDEEGLFRLFHGNYENKTQAIKFIDDMSNAGIENWYRQVRPSLNYFELSVQ